MDKKEEKITIAMAGSIDISKEKMAMVSIIMSFKDFTNPVSMQSISDAALQRKKELEVGTDENIGDKYQKAIDDFDDVEVSEGDVKVVFQYMGEGLSGEYGESENDVPMLRFDIYEKSYLDNGDGIEHPDWDWVPLESGSYCTTVSIDTPKEILEKMVKYILDEVKDYIDSGRSVRHVAAGLSHISGRRF